MTDTNAPAPDQKQPSTPAEVRQALAQLYRDIGDHVAQLPDRFFTGQVDPVSRQAVVVLREVAVPTSSIALGLSFGTGTRSSVPKAGQKLVRNGLDTLGHMPMLNHLRECPGHTTEGHHDDDDHAPGPDAVDAGGSAPGEPDRAVGEGRG